MAPVLTDEPWDELMGPPPVTSEQYRTTEEQVNKFLRGDLDLIDPSIEFLSPTAHPTPLIRVKSTGHNPPSSVPLTRVKSTGPPPSAFYTSNNNSSSIHSSAGFGMPERWAKYEATLEETKEATQRAVAIASERDGLPAMVSSGNASVSSTASASSISFQASGAAKRKTNIPIEQIETDHRNNNSKYTISDDFSDGEDSYRDFPKKDDPPETRPQYDHYNTRAHHDPGQIRQEALKLLEVTDDQLGGTSTYSIHRTITGGFMASPNSLGPQKRIPTALSGLNFTGARTTKKITPVLPPSVSYRDHHTAESDDDEEDIYVRAINNSNPPPPPPGDRVDFEYGDEDIVDYIKTGQNKKTQQAKSWSSRYSIDSTLLAITGGLSSQSTNRKILDQLDADTDAALFKTSPSRNSTGLFGSGGFNSFRQNKLFSKSDPTFPQSQPNLRTVWIDIEKEHAGDRTQDSDDDSHTRPKSWSEQLAMKQKHNRAIIFIVSALIIFAVTLSMLLGDGRGATPTIPTTSSQSAAVNDVVPVNNTLPDDAIQFYVTANSPYTAADDDILVTKLQAMDTNADFFLHLGNIQLSNESKCDESVYSRAASLLGQSPIPTFILPGDEDWPMCPNPEEAWGYWYRHFSLYDTRYQHSYSVARQMNRLENFAFVSDNILFVGIHLIGGSLNETDLAQRNSADLVWIQAMVKDHLTVRAVVIFGNGGPALMQNVAFFQGLTEFLTSVDKRHVYIHAASAHSAELKKEYWVGDLFVLQVPSGSNHAFLQVVVNTTGRRPFTFSD